MTINQLIIIGGGITGLSAAYYADKYAREANIDYHITLLEASDRFGGKLITSYDGGFIVEGGPDSFLTSKPWAHDLAKELNLDLIGTNDQQRHIFVLKDSTLHRLPGGLRLVVPLDEDAFMQSNLLSAEGKRRILDEVNIPPRTDPSDESLGEFVRRRFGEEMLRVIGEPMMAGIYVADADQLSMQASFPQFAQIEREHGSLIRYMRGRRQQAQQAVLTSLTGDKTTMFVTPRRGLQALVDRLVDVLFESDTVDLHLHRPVSQVEHTDEGYFVHLDGGANLLAAKQVILTTPAYATKEILRPNFDEELIRLLENIEYSTTATVSLAYHAEDITHPLNGFGFIVPHTEPTPLLASTWTSTKFDHRAPHDHILLRAFVGGEDVQRSDADINALVRGELQRLMGISSSPLWAKIFRWYRGSPLYRVGHLDRVSRMESLCPPGLYLAGSPYRGVGIPDCVHQAQQVAQKIMSMHVQ